MVGLDLLDAQRRSLKAQNEELDRRRRDAEEASSRKTRLLTSVSHDIRTPVSTINLMADLLCRTAGNDRLAVQVPDLAHRLQASALALADLVGDVLDVARLDAAEVELRLSDFCLNDLLAEACARLRPLAEAKNLWLKVEVPEGRIRLRSDRVKLVRVVENLLGNAIKYTHIGGVTATAACGPDGAASIRVTDTGVGIPPEQLGRVFGEFVQLGNREGNRSSGYGLGLAICRRLVQSLGGTITAESQPGRGSAFTVRLPASCVVVEAPKRTTLLGGGPRRAGADGASLGGRQ
jgi:signal transduction histidine kinase